MPKMHLVQKMVGRVVSTIFSKLAMLDCQKKSTQISISECILAGCQYYRAEGIWTFLRVGEMLRLKREPQNQYDPNAIAVYFKNDMLGFIPSSENELLAQMMDQGAPLEACITQLLSDSKAGRSVRFSVFSGSKRHICPINTLHMSWE